jgi:hypothetical protein
MKAISRVLFAALLIVAGATAASAQPFPSPIVRYVNQQPSMGGIQVNLTVVNWNAYAPIYFTPTPQLPPCGLNLAASRTWVEIHNFQGNATLNTFCAFGSPSDLKAIWFFTQPANKPKAVYVILWDRRANKKVKSNVVKIP